MSEREFENQVAALFAEPASLPDQNAFEAKLAQRIERRFDKRRFFLLGCGLLGACVSLPALTRLRPIVEVPSLQPVKLFNELVAVVQPSIAVVVFVALLLPVLARTIVDPR